MHPWSGPAAMAPSAVRHSARGKWAGTTAAPRAWSGFRLQLPDFPRRLPPCPYGGVTSRQPRQMDVLQRKCARTPAERRSRWLRDGIGLPQRRDRQPSPLQQPSSQRQADADDARRVAVDRIDEPTAQAVEREPACNPQRFAAGDVGVQLACRWCGEMNCGDECFRTLMNNLVVMQSNYAVTRVQLSGAAGHRLPLPPGLVTRGGLAAQLAAAVQHRVAADHNAIRGDRQVK